MRSVLGIDAAWTTKNPSGVALVNESRSGWTLDRVESSYERFQRQTHSGSAVPSRPSGSQIDVAAILRNCERRLGTKVDLIAVDMPLSRNPITGRRVADNRVSKAYGARNAGTHSPSALRPGPISDAMTAAFAESGYPLQTQKLNVPGLIEVYPHTALLELSRDKDRHKYKVAKCRSYWKDLSPAQRVVSLLIEWERIVCLLEAEIKGIRRWLPPLKIGASGVDLKAYEDALDSVICAWVGICALEGRARPFGDEDAAIWIPSPTQRGLS